MTLSWGVNSPVLFFNLTVCTGTWCRSITSPLQTPARNSTHVSNWGKYTKKVRRTHFNQGYIPETFCLSINSSRVRWQITRTPNPGRSQKRRCGVSTHLASGSHATEVILLRVLLISAVGTSNVHTSAPFCSGVRVFVIPRFFFIENVDHADSVIVR